MSAVEKLWQNDPERTKIWIHLHCEPSDADLAHALEQNPFVTDIILTLHTSQTDWNSFLRVIAMRANLKKVTLQGAKFGWERNAPAVVVRSLLRAIQQNNHVRSTKLIWLCLPNDISTFINNASSIASFSLFECYMDDPAEQQQGASDLVAALQRNTNIETLNLGGLENISTTIPILESLRSNVSLKNFISSIEITDSDAASRAIQQLLESTTSIQRFELQEADFGGERLFRPIAQGIINSECVSEIKLSECRFEDRESFAQLQGILQNKQNLTTLSLEDCDFVGRQVHRDIISLLSQPDLPLQCFEFQSYGDLEREFPGVQFKNLVQAIQNCKLLERFKIGTIRTQQQLQTLTQSIPSMRIRELEVFFWGQILHENADPRQNMLLAIKNNFSLRSVKGSLFGTAEDKKTLAFCANRNESLDQWVNNPEIVKQRKVWPEALNLAQRAGPNALFRGMRSVLERDYGSLPGKRKRKRPQFYTPI